MSETLPPECPGKIDRLLVRIDQESAIKDTVWYLPVLSGLAAGGLSGHLIHELAFPKNDAYNSTTTQIKSLRYQLNDLYQAQNTLEQAGATGYPKKVNQKVYQLNSQIAVAEDKIPAGYDKGIDELVSYGGGFLVGATVLAAGVAALTNRINRTKEALEA